MAMNKKEKQHIEDLKEMIEMGDTLLALRLTERVAPDLKPPKESGERVNGFSFNVYSRRVSKSCSSGVSHGFSGHDKTTSQRPISQYSTRLLALKAVRHEMEIESARELRKIDLMIDKESDN